MQQEKDRAQKVQVLTLGPHLGNNEESQVVLEGMSYDPDGAGRTGSNVRSLQMNLRIHPDTDIQPPILAVIFQFQLKKMTRVIQFKVQYNIFQKVITFLSLQLNKALCIFAHSLESSGGPVRKVLCKPHLRDICLSTCLQDTNITWWNFIVPTGFKELKVNTTISTHCLYPWPGT